MARDRREEVMLAVNEACANAVTHAYPDGPGEFEVRAEQVEGQVVVEVHDEGVGMSPRLDSPGLGVGLPMMAMLADSVQIDRPPGGGTHVRMRFSDRLAASGRDQAASDSRSLSRIDERP